MRDDGTGVESGRRLHSLESLFVEAGTILDGSSVSEMDPRGTDLSYERIAPGS
jgi:hypothetical protein